jgi:secreted PhoX family phosphatase
MVMINPFSFFKNKLSRQQKSSAVEDVPAARRWFLKGIALSGSAVVAATGTAAAWAKLRPAEPVNYQEAYLKDVLPGQKILEEEGFAEIPREEIDDLVQTLVDGYDFNKQA